MHWSQRWGVGTSHSLDEKVMIKTVGRNVRSVDRWHRTYTLEVELLRVCRQRPPPHCPRPHPHFNVRLHLHLHLTPGSLSRVLLQGKCSFLSVSFSYYSTASSVQHQHLDIGRAGHYHSGSNRLPPT